MKAKPVKIERVKRILNRHMSGGAKLYRILMQIRPKDFRPSVMFKKNIEDANRIQKLTRRMAYQTIGNNNAEALYESWNALKSSLKIFTIGSFKDYFRQRREEQKNLARTI